MGQSSKHYGNRNLKDAKPNQRVQGRLPQGDAYIREKKKKKAKDQCAKIQNKHTKVKKKKQG